MYEPSRQLHDTESDNSTSSSIVTAPIHIRAWFEAEVLPLSPTVIHYLRQHSPNASDIEDLYQEVLLRAYEAASANIIPFSIKTFLFQIARNLIADHQRGFLVPPTNAAASIAKFEVADLSASPEDRVIMRQQLEQFLSAFSKLSSPARQAILLRRVIGLSLCETAKRMGVSERTIEGYLTIGLRHLTKRFPRGALG